MDEYDAATDRWTCGPTSREALVRSSSGGASVLTGHGLLTWATAITPRHADCPPGASCGLALEPVTYLYSPDRDQWQTLTAGPRERLDGATTLRMGHEFLVAGGTGARGPDGTRREEPALRAGTITVRPFSP